MFRFTNISCGKSLMIRFKVVVKGSSLCLIFNYKLYGYDIWQGFKDKY